ncbi:uncharacterized protein L969DRAFT_22718 [Mixia osmundae IAM 14324]|uniref:Sidoreflexin n=1 Tax=Mixia osmundae (strain CBS 9802 / IAM 14324 / JCM 22182 / KY 12970) TaxID=764103 RepID=G7E5H6_MIXOS|nr:uncharacterized protein L969DRAFT_22718 [Mixia osmundae IAM 14324]KEI40765.1 hypothetical protein L969DRAFT_22718 [Mixia osmundae IAM 14324]GAA98086.1 hypothetical protein E5Q_04768 [Mixia osmundae IAM 14324]
MTTKQAPPIDISKSRYDQSKFSGRLRHFIEITSPLTLFYSSQDLINAQKLVQDYKDGKRSDLYNQQGEQRIWKAKQLVDSSIHPDTGLPVPLPFRLSAFVPTNLFVVGGMLMPNPSMRAIIFWQWANQTLNVCVNYANANKSIEMSTAEIGTAYATATSVSVAIAVGLNQLVPRLKVAASTKALLGRLVPFVAVATAGCANIGLMRWKEIRDGIDVFAPGSEDEEEKPKSLGKSSVAGSLAISQTAASRVLTNIPTLIIPPVTMTFLLSKGFFQGPRGKRVESVVHLGLIGTSLLLFLPPAIAVFPQRATVSTSTLEEKYRDLKDPKTGKPLSTVEFNKGL